MKIAIWYHTSDKNPDTSGYYLAFRGFGMGGPQDGESAYDTLYYDSKRKQWRSSRSSFASEEIAFVYYWTDALPNKWVDEDPAVIHRKNTQKNASLESALNDVLAAIERYEIIRGLSK